MKKAPSIYPATHPIFDACEKGYIEIVRKSLDDGIPVDAVSSDGFITWALACQFGHLEIVKLLVERGLDPNIRTELRGIVPLNNAIIDGHLEIVEYLLSKGADPNAADDTGLPVLMLAARFPKIVKALLDAGANPHLKTPQGFNCFTTAAEVNQVEVMEMLHQRGVDVNHQSAGKLTALHKAAMKGRREACEWLLAHGADRTLKNDIKQTPRDMALMHDHQAVADLLA